MGNTGLLRDTRLTPWSHAIDEVSNNGVLATPFNNSNAAFSATPSNVQYQINPTCLRCYNYGDADYDVRNPIQQHRPTAHVAG